MCVSERRVRPVQSGRRRGADERQHLYRNRRVTALNVSLIVWTKWGLDWIGLPPLLGCELWRCELGCHVMRSWSLLSHRTWYFWAVRLDRCCFVAFVSKIVEKRLSNRHESVTIGSGLGLGFWDHHDQVRNFELNRATNNIAAPKKAPPSGSC